MEFNLGQLRLSNFLRLMEHDGGLVLSQNQLTEAALGLDARQSNIRLSGGKGLFCENLSKLNPGLGEGIVSGTSVGNQLTGEIPTQSWGVSPELAIDRAVPLRATS